MVPGCSFTDAFILLSLLATCQASILSSRTSNPSHHANRALELPSVAGRALPNAPDGYTPEAGDCPSARPQIRSATGLSRNETAWLKSRRTRTVEPMRNLLGRLNISGFDAAAYITSNAKNTTALPNVAIAFSGGGYRALLNGAGALQAFDNRETNSTTSGHLGGLLQASTYVAGLSGGSWLVGSIFVNNFTTVNALQTAPSPGSVWEFENSIFEGPATGGLQLLDTAQYFNHVDDAVDAKKGAGFNTSVSDYWGRALSYQLINASDGGPSYTWSSIALNDDFANGNTPMPVVVADGRAPGELLIPGNTTIYEFNPWELGTFDPTTYGFAPLEFLGSNFSSGILPDDQQCVRGYDNAGFVMGTSSSLFNQFLLQVNQTSIPDLAKRFINNILTNIGQDNNDIADYSPNPFYHYHNSTSHNAQSKRLTLVDGGEDLENIPLHPLIQPVREVDVIFAIDSSADTDNYWPNGTSLVATYQRSLDDISNGTSFPAVPDQNSFVNLGLNTHPTFFGCDSSNTTSTTPLIVYLPNHPYVYHSNVSTFDPSYTTTERDNIILNGYAVATMGNATKDSTWPTCVGCAILQRSMERTGTPIPDVCTSCFKKWCWDGSVNSTQPAAYDPPYSIAVVDADSGSGSLRRSTDGLFAVVAGVVVMILMMAW